MLRNLWFFSLLGAACLLWSGCPSADDDDSTSGDDDDDAVDDDSTDDDDTVADDDDSAQQGPRLQVTPTSLAFGGICIGSNLQREFLMRNIGGAPLNIQGITSDAAQVAADNFNGTLNPQDTPVEITVTMTCTQEATVQGLVQIASNDPGSPTGVAVVGFCEPC